MQDVSVPYGDCVRLQPRRLHHRPQRLQQLVSVPYGDCVRLQHFRVRSGRQLGDTDRFQSPTGIVFGCNSTNNKLWQHRNSKKFQSPTGIVFGCNLYSGKWESCRIQRLFQSPTGIVFGCNIQKATEEITQLKRAKFQSPTGIVFGCNSPDSLHQIGAGNVSVPYGDCVRLQPQTDLQQAQAALQVSVPYGDCVRLQPFHSSFLLIGANLREWVYSTAKAGICQLS